MQDITIIYITANLIPDKFAEYVRSTLKKAIGDKPLISISRKPLDFGINILDTELKSTSNIYWQMLKAAKLATTPYVAIAEDDTLYQKEHFDFCRPPLDTFAYNQNRWALFTWGKPTYSMRDRVSNASLIAPRELLIEALEERFAKYPKGTPAKITGELGRPMVDRNLGIKVQKVIWKYSTVSLIQFNHAGSSEELQRNQRKRMGMVRAYDIPYWRRAKDLVKIYE